MKVLVLTGQTEVDDAVKALGDDRFKTSMFADKPDLERQVREFAPNVLHFFCHGATEQSSYLLIATMDDFARRPQTEGFAVETREIKRLLGGLLDLPPDIWLVTLNACRGAAAPEQGRSLVRHLASEGLPAVVGMREMVAADDSHAFAESFYEELIAKLAEVARTNDVVEIEWAELVREPRRRILDRYLQGRPAGQGARDVKEWSLPIVYVGQESFIIRNTGPANARLTEKEREEMSSELEMLKKMLAEMKLKPSTPARLLAEMDARIQFLGKALAG
jgi:hypothetical protein